MNVLIDPGYAWKPASELHYNWFEECVCFDCPCGAKELILGESGAITECDCGRVYRYQCLVVVDDRAAHEHDALGSLHKIAVGFVEDATSHSAISVTVLGKQDSAKQEGVGG